MCAALLSGIFLSLPQFACQAAPSTAATPLSGIQKLIASGQYQKAITDLDKVIANQPDNALAHYLRGQALEKLGSRNDAIQAYETASLLAPGAKFAVDCQQKMSGLLKPAAPAQKQSDTPSASSTKGVIKKGKQVTPFQLRGEQSRMLTEVSDQYKKELQAEVGRLHDLANNGPMHSSGVQQSFGPPPPAPPPTPQQNASTEQLAANIPAGRLTAVEKENLAKYDVIFIVDHSGSMAQPDCPQNSSRWNWLAAQVFSIIRDAKECFPRGLNVVMFDDNAEEYTKLKPEEFLQLFNKYGPSGGTNTGHAFRSQMQNVRARLLEHRPVMVVGITDGLPNNPGELQDAFFELRQMAGRSSSPLKVSLLHIGASSEGLKTLSELELLTRRGVTYGTNSFVKVYPFADLVKYGLSRTLMKILNE